MDNTLLSCDPTDKKDVWFSEFKPYFDNWSVASIAGIRSDQYRCK
jgi:hypothetical protein